MIEIVFYTESITYFLECINILLRKLQYFIHAVVVSAVKQRKEKQVSLFAVAIESQKKSSLSVFANNIPTRILRLANVSLCEYTYFSC